jgi:hypothetical protein
MFITEILSHTLLDPCFYHLRSKGSLKPEKPYFPPHSMKLILFNRQGPVSPSRVLESGTKKGWIWRQTNKHHIQNPGAVLSVHTNQVTVTMWLLGEVGSYNYTTSTLPERGMWGLGI